MFGLAEWGARHAFGDPRPEELDPETLMWWFHGRIDTADVPGGRWSRSTSPTAGACSGWSSSPSDASVCYTDPGFEVDAVMRADLATLYQVWEAEIDLLDAVKAGIVELSGARWVVAGLPRWLLLSPVAPIVRAGPRPVRHADPPGLHRPRSAYPWSVLGRITIDAVRPATPTGEFPAKAVVGERVPVSADIFRDGHDLLAARVRWRRVGKAQVALRRPLRRRRQRPVGGRRSSRPRSVATSS